MYMYVQEEFELPAYLMTADERERREEHERTTRAREAVRGEDGRFRPQSPPPPAGGAMAAGGGMQLAVAGGEEQDVDVDEEFLPWRVRQRRLQAVRERESE